jgi:TRAP-type C4-dicarboxylate transport system substrate-binding protein
MKTMSKLSFGFLVVALVLLFAPPGFSAEQKAVTLKWAMPSPPSGVFEKNSQWIAEEITRRTNGRVKFEFFWSGTLLKYQDIVVGIGKGVADVGEAAGLFTANLHPSWTTINQVAVGKDSYVMQWASYEMLHTDPEIRAEFDKLNIVPTNGYGPGTEVFVFKKPVTKFEDFKGLRLRTYGEAFPKVVSTLGAVPVNLPLTDVYESMSRGVIDGSFAAMARAHALKWGEVGKHWSSSIYCQATVDVTTAFNKNVWNSFTDETRKTISDVFRESNDRVQMVLAEAEKEMRKELAAMGVQFHRFSPEVDAQYFKAARAVSEEWFTKNDAKGLKTRAVFDHFTQLVAKYEKQVQEKGYPWAPKK